MAEFPNERLLILDTPRVKRPEGRKLHTPHCRWAFRPGGRDRTYREATAEEIRTQSLLSRFGRPLNVARRAGSRTNDLHKLLRGWFGPIAGQRGTDHHVELRRTVNGWELRPSAREAENPRADVPGAR